MTAPVSKRLVLIIGGAILYLQGSTLKPLAAQTPSAEDLASQPATSEPSPEWHDPAPRSTTFVEVEKGVKLEVLDWGGAGRPIVLLAGLQNTAHVFDSFAPQLVTKYHVYGITRRGFGASTTPASGYTADRLGDDVLAVLNALNISKPVLVGHSLAGEELSSIGSRYPDRVAGLIYLDAAYTHAYQNPALPEIVPGMPELNKTLTQLSTAKPTAADMANFAAFQLWLMKAQGMLIPEAELHQLFRTDASGRITASRTDPSTVAAILAGGQRYTHVPVPMLAIYAIPPSWGGMFDNIDAVGRAKLQATEATLLAMTNAFESGNPSARVVRIPHANHYVFLSNEEDVLREMNAWLGKLP
jgi:non-heme chloroperoxidase